MVGMLGCGCCGPTDNPDNPIYYGPCDCGTDNEVLRGDYLETFDEPIPDLPIFVRPGGDNGYTNPYTDWIYNGRFHVTCKPTWNNVINAPFWSGYAGQPYGIAGSDNAYNSKNSRFNSQFVFNEFDYEYEWDFHVSSSCKPTFVIASAPFISSRVSAYLNFFDTNQSPDFTRRYDNAIELVHLSYHGEAIQLQLTPATRHELLLINTFNPITNPIRQLQYDRTYKLKKRLTSNATFGQPGIPTLTVQWFLDGDFLIGYNDWPLPGLTWVGCNPTYARFLSCGWIQIDGYVEPRSLYASDPSSGFWVDNFKFDAIPK